MERRWLEEAQREATRLEERRLRELRAATPRPCEVCGAELIPGSWDRRFCSNKCRQRSYRLRSSAVQRVSSQG